MKKAILALCLILGATAAADTPPLSSVNAKILDGNGVKILSTNDGSGVGLNVHISNASLPITATIDTGNLATSVLQTTINATLEGISTQLPLLLGQTTKANSLSCAIASDQTIPVSGTFWQTTQPVSIVGTVPVTFASFPGTLVVTQTSGDNLHVNVDNLPSTQAVTGTFFQSVQPVSISSSVPITAASLPLMTGAATAANQASLIAQISTLITNLGSPFQTGDLIGNTGFAINGTLPAYASTPTFNVGNLNGAATASNQITGNTSLATIATNIPAGLTVTSTRLLVDGSGVTQPVSIAGTVPVSFASFPDSQVVTQPDGTNLHTTVDNFPSTQAVSIASSVPVTAAALPLPSGAATAALQTAGNTSLSSIVTSLGGTLSVDASGHTIPVSGTFFQTTQPVSISGTIPVSISSFPSSQIVTQDDGSNLHVDVDNFPSTQAVTGTFFQATQPVSIASSVPVTGTFFQTTQPVSLSSIPSPASLPLPNGAATAALQVTGNSALTAINTTLGTPFQTGDSIGNTAFGINGTLPAYASTPTFNLGTLNGAATAALQSTGNGSLTSIATSTANIPADLTVSSNRLLVDGSGVTQPVSISGTVPVSIASFPLTQVVTQSDGSDLHVDIDNFPSTQAVTGTFFQATQPVSISGTIPVSIASFPLTQVVTQASGANLHTDVDNFPSTQAVTGTFWQTTQPVSISSSVPITAASLPLPTGLTVTSTRLLVDGSGVTQPVSISGTVPVTITSFPSSQVVTQVSGSNLHADIDNFPSTQAVSGTFFQATQPVSIASPVPITAASLPLPAGAATSSAQGTSNTLLSALISALGTPFQTGDSISNTGFAINGTLPAFATTPTFNLGTLNGAATSALQTTGNASLSNIAASLAGTITVDASGHTVPVSGTFFQATQPVSIASLPGLASGANTIGNVNINGTVPVLIASFPATQVVTQTTGSNLHTDVDNFPSSQAVTGTFFQTTQPVSIASLPGLASSANTIGNVNINGTIPVSVASFPLTQVVTQASGANLHVDIDSIPVTAITAASLPLPALAATSTLQTTGNTSLATVATNTTAISTNTARIPTGLTVTSTRLLVDGSGVTQPVSIASFPLTQVVSQASGANLHTDVDNFPSTQAVTGAFFQATQPISAASLPLMAGAATAALQTTGNTALTTINTTLGSPFQAGGAISNTSFIATQSTGSNLHVDIDSIPTTAITAASLPLPSGAATSALQTTINTTLGSPMQNSGGSVAIVSLPALASGPNTIGNVNINGTVPVSGTFWQTTQPVSLATTPSPASLPLPTGAATAALQSSEIAVLGSPFQAGGTISNTAFAISGTLPAYASTPTFNFGTLNGAATASLQTTGNTSLATIAANIPSGLTVVSNRLEVDGSGVTQPVSIAGTLPVSIASFPLTQTVNQASGADLHVDVDNFPTTQAISAASLPLMSGAATSALQTTGNTALTTINTTLGSPMQNSGGSVTANAGTGTFVVDASGHTVPVSGTFWQTTQPVSIASVLPVSVASLPLPAGAATSSLQTTGNTALTTINTTLGSPFQAGGSISNTGFLINGTLPAYASTPTFNFGTLNGAATAALQTTGNTTLTTINTTLGTPMQQSGGSIVNISGTVSLPTGAATSALQTTGNTSLSSIATSLAGVLNISAASLPLPTGAATASLQTTGNTALTTINTTLGTPFQSGGAISNTGFLINGTLPAYASTPTFNFGTLNGAATASLQTAGNSSLTTLATNLPPQGQALAGSSLPVVLTAAQMSTLTPLTSITVTQASGANLHADVDNFPAVQAISVASLPLPSGAATSSLQTTGNTALTTINTTLGSPMQQSGGSIVNISGTVSLPTGAATSALQTTGNTALTTINTTLGTPMQNSGGSVTANAGTNLNTSLLALESGGNLAAAKLDVDNLALAQGSTTSGQKGSLPLAAVTASAPTYTTSQSSPISLKTTGDLRVDSAIADTALATINTTLGTPFQAGGAISNTVFGATESGTWNVGLNAGTNNVGSLTNITGTISLPTGAATSANQTSQITQETTTATNTTSILANQTNGTQKVSTNIASSGTPTQTSVSCGTSSTSLLAASTATKFISIRNPTTATVTVWINIAGAAATSAAPSIDLPPGGEADYFASENSFLPTSAITCIAASAQTVTLVYK